MSATDRAARAAAADGICQEAYAAAGGPEAGVALVAVGGYGRAELAPHSDLDVVLVHEPGVDPGAMGEQLWYPLWNSGRRLDHAVRSLPEMVDAAQDLRVALGLLDVRHLAGDSGLAMQLRTTMLADWRRRARQSLPELRALVAKRHAVLGELAHESVPDLKEAEGGLRDAGVLRALEATWLVDASTPASESARMALLDVRDELHDLAGRPTDRVAPELWAPLAERLGLADAEAAQRHVRSLGRRITHVSRLSWRRVDAVLARPSGERGRRTPALQPVARGIALSRGEVVLDRQARPAADPTLLLRAAAEAASRDVVLAPVTAARLVREAPSLPVPWPAEARDALVRLLAGPGLLHVWETLEETGALETFLPEWDAIRLLPHASAIHRFTVDRHSVETCTEAAALIRSVARPDVLMVAALLHDIGKGELVEHSVAGEPIAREIATRMGFDAAAVDMVGALVRWHLLLGETATTRDPDDPVTVERVLARFPTAQGLALLHALTEADARATAPQAWSSWRATLIDRLVERARSVVAGDAPAEDEPTLEVPVAQSSTIQVDVATDEEGARVTVVAADRVGLLADIAGALALLRVSVRSARAWSQLTDGEEWACSLWEVADADLDPGVLRDRLRRVVAGEEVRLPSYGDRVLPPTVAVRGDSSRRCAVLEVRAADRPGTLYDVLGTLAGLDLAVRSAHVATLGPQAVDVFYVQEPGGVRPSDERAAEAARALRGVLAGAR
ncbi:[protein-PII] uridylyltransferase [Nocardioides seonyuensis]|uniref:Bifunctional uridylyltransferase/uridylyl-removing enzyme n=1 Tax=Nocardioides seonyuensis TaxID=2518371 RepID=A0A4P7IAW7_9ACTN|nr:[protein-PII] uridylyltransferase [Nocardioides seonyuensis]QBX54178.1 [protein-PII] uridylyltransferase [Nocardioides seonyuensis]